MATIFQKIIAHEIPAHIVYEDERTIAFLDIAPVSRGHTLVIPKTPIDQIDDLADEDYENLMKVTRKLALNLREKLKPIRIGRMVYGLDVLHVHIHLIPLYSGNEMLLRNKGQTTEDDELEILLREIKI